MNSLVLVLPALPVSPMTGPLNRARPARAKAHNPSSKVSCTTNCDTLTPSVLCGTIIATAPAASASAAKCHPSRALAKLDTNPPLGVPLNATNKLPGFTSRLSCVTKSILVSGNVPGRLNARATSAIVHNGAALMQPSEQALPQPRHDR